MMKVMMIMKMMMIMIHLTLCHVRCSCHHPITYQLYRVHQFMRRYGITVCYR